MQNMARYKTFSPRSFSSSHLIVFLQWCASMKGRVPVAHSSGSTLFLWPISGRPTQGWHVEVEHVKNSVMLLPVGRVGGSREKKLSDYWQLRRRGGSTGTAWLQGETRTARGKLHASLLQACPALKFRFEPPPPAKTRNKSVKDAACRL